MTFNKAFYEKHGIKVTEEPIGKFKNAEQNALENALHAAVTTKNVTPQTVKLVEQAVEKYPESEALKNYLYGAYSKIGLFQKAIDCLHNTIKLHPNYVFGLVNLVNHHLFNNELDKAAALLTEPYDVRRAEKEDFIHHSVFISYYQTVVRLALAKGDIKTAEKYHRLMFDYDPKNVTVREIAAEILRGRMTAMQKNMSARVESTVVATNRAIAGWQPSNKAPVFIHPEVHQLYKVAANDDMPRSLIKTLLALPRETFIQDLENILADMVRRRDYHLSHAEWDENTMAFPIHAINFLTELRAYNSLPTILNILRQDEDFLEFWFSVEIHDYFYPCIYILGNTQLPLLQSFAIESNNLNWSRNLASDIAAQTALRQPERRDEVLAWFKTVMQTHLNQPKNNGIIDTTFLGSVVGDCLNFTAIELEPEIIALYEKGWVGGMMSDNLEEAKASLRDPDYYYGNYSDLPVSIHEMYSREYSDKMEERELDPNRAKKREELEEDPYNKFLSDEVFKKMGDKRANSYDDYEDRHYAPPQETVRRVEPKLGRNDPCHCGSGKKYKKCHGA
jgi:tetratricopeptide (TPR) repeat protein